MSPTSTAAPDLAETFKQVLELPFSWTKLLYTLLLFVVCLVVMKVLTTLMDRAIEHLGVEKSLHTFIKSIIRILLWFVTIIIVLGFVGVDMTSLIAILSVVGLAISLAIQGTLSNLAGGIMILVSKPFKVGDYIQAGGIEGAVSDIGLVYTRVKTFDNKLIFVPNGEMSGEKITNFTNQETRRVDIKFCTGYADDPELVKKCIHAVIGVHSKALFTPEPFVRVSAYKESAVEFSVRVWCATEDYWDLYFDLLEQVREAFRKNGIEMTYNHLNVHVLPEGDTRDPAAERGGTAWGGNL